MAIEVNESTFFQEVLSLEKPVLVDFWAPWCGPCKMLSPIIDEIAIEYEGRAKIVKVNVETNMHLASAYQVTSVPCLMLFKNGIVIQRSVGFKSKNDLKDLMDKELAYVGRDEQEDQRD